MIVLALGIATAVAVGMAFYKHGNLQNVIKSAKAEASNLESMTSKVATEAQTSFNAIVAKLKALK